MSPQDTVKERENAAAAARAALHEAALALDLAKDALVANPSEKLADAAERALRIRDRAALLCEAHETRLAEAQAALAATDRAKIETAFADASTKASPAYFHGEIKPSLDRIAELDRAIADAVRTILAAGEKQKLASFEGRRLAMQLGQPAPHSPLSEETLRAIVRCTIRDTRRQTSRNGDPNLSQWLAPAPDRVSVTLADDGHAQRTAEALLHTAGSR